MADNKDGREFIRSLSFKDTVTGDIEKASLYVGNIVVWPDGRETELDQETYKKYFSRYVKEKTEREERQKREEEEAERKRKEAEEVARIERMRRKNEEAILAEKARQEELMKKELESKTEEPEPEYNRSGFDIKYINTATGVKSETPEGAGFTKAEDIENTEAHETTGEVQSEPDVTEVVEEIRVAIEAPESEQSHEGIPAVVPAEIQAEEKTEKEEKPPKETRLKKEKDPLRSKLNLLIFLIIILLLSVVGLAVYTLKDKGIVALPWAAATETPEQENTASDAIVIVRANKDIPKGKLIESDDLAVYEMGEKEYNQANGTTYIAADGSTSEGTLVLAESINTVIGKFATRDIRRGEYITVKDFSVQKVVAEKTYVDVEIDGEMVSVPVDSALAGETSVKIVALVQSEGQEGTIAISLSEFVLQDRSLQDIFDSAGRSILEQIAAEKVTKGEE